MTQIKLKKGEAKTVTFTVKDRTSGSPIDVSLATLTYTVKTSNIVGTATISKDDADFTKTNAANGVVSVILNETDTNITPGTYVSELKTRFGTTMSDKSTDIDFIIGTAINN